MPKLEVNVDAYFEAVREENRLSMMDDPEVDDIEDPHQRRTEADAWLEARRDQIESHKRLADADLLKASQAGFLSPQKYYAAIGLCGAVYAELGDAAKQKYDEMIEGLPEQNRTHHQAADQR